MWTAAELESEARPAQGKIWRCVEHQHTISTRKLVDSLGDQEILEDILDESKPAYPEGTEHLHYLLKTPFRYEPPHPPGSRFRRPFAEHGIFYGAETIATALAEFGYWRSVFFNNSPGTKLPDDAENLTTFSAKYNGRVTLDLTTSPFSAHEATWMHPNDYTQTQELADLARAAEIESIRYKSVRDPEHHCNVALLHPAAFACTKPICQQTWYLHLSSDKIEFTRASSDEQFVFDRIL